MNEYGWVQYNYVMLYFALFCRLPESRPED